ncbi:MAG: Acetoin utilization protein AcuC [Anaerolineae bacterium]|nr:Acetoin utilization protein AcuC [Anaerolineae bacterium]
MSLPIVYHPGYVTPLPPEHRFPMPKFGVIYDILLRDGLASLDQFHVPQIAPRAWLEQVHTPEYIAAFCGGTLDAKAIRRIGLPWSPNLVKRTRTAVGGSVLTARLALEHGLACNTAGGTHHAFAGFGSGFCIFNDLAVTARLTQQMGPAHKVLIVDLDVHQGDGTASIFADDATVFTFSMHCQSNFPFHKQQSDLDVPLPDGADDALYLKTLAAHLPDVLSQFRPDLVLYDAGVDPHHADRLGKLSLTDAGLFERDKYVLHTCMRQGYPVATVVGGGYDKNVLALAYRHVLLFRAAAEVFLQVA